MAKLYPNPTLLEVKLFGQDLANKRALLANLIPGDRVTILRPAGIGRNGQEWAEATGRVVMADRTNLTATLNMGGRYGTPGVATEANIIRATRPANGPKGGFIFRGPA